jgi:hypothetical protein
MTRWLWLCGFLGAVVFLGGCGPEAPKTVKVSGTVNLDDKPLPEGEVTLVGASGTVPDVFLVKEGKFQGQAKPGKVKVEIRVYKEAKPPPKDGTEAGPNAPPSRENILPARFNTESTLTAEVKDSGLNPSKFDVESK